MTSSGILLLGLVATFVLTARADYPVEGYAAESRTPILTNSPRKLGSNKDFLDCAYTSSDNGTNNKSPLLKGDQLVGEINYVLSKGVAVPNSVSLMNSNSKFYTIGVDDVYVTRSASPPGEKTWVINTLGYNEQEKKLIARGSRVGPPMSYFRQVGIDQDGQEKRYDLTGTRPNLNGVSVIEAKNKTADPKEVQTAKETFLPEFERRFATAHASLKAYFRLWQRSPPYLTEENIKVLREAFCSCRRAGVSETVLTKAKEEILGDKTIRKGNFDSKVFESLKSDEFECEHLGP